MTTVISSNVKVKPNEPPGHEKKSINVKSPRRASIFFPTKEEQKEQILKSQEKNGNITKLIELTAKQFQQKVTEKMNNKKVNDEEYIKLKKELDQIDNQINQIKKYYDPLCKEIENNKIKYGEIKLVNENLNEKYLEIGNNTKHIFNKESHKMSLFAKKEALQVLGGAKKSVLACVKGIEDKKISTPKSKNNSVMFSPINNIKSPREEINKSKTIIPNLNIPFPGSKDFNDYQKQNSSSVSFNTPRIKTSKFGNTT